MDTYPQSSGCERCFEAGFSVCIYWLSDTTLRDLISYTTLNLNRLAFLLISLVFSPGWG